MTHPTRLRAAEANPSDGAVFAHFLDEAADGLFAFLLGSGAEQVLARLIDAGISAKLLPW